MKTRFPQTALFLFASLVQTGCVMFDAADDFPQPCYGPDCMGGGLAQYGNAKYGHNGGYIDYDQRRWNGYYCCLPNSSRLPGNHCWLRLGYRRLERCNCV